MQQKTKKSTKRTSRLTLSIIIGSVLIILLIFDISPYGGNIRFYSKWISCGQKPVVEDTSFGFGAQIPSYKIAEVFEPLRFGQPEYFCTPLEAEQAGYSANPNYYDFPHLNLNE